MKQNINFFIIIFIFINFIGSLRCWYGLQHGFDRTINSELGTCNEKENKYLCDGTFVKSDIDMNKISNFLNNQIRDKSILNHFKMTKYQFKQQFENYISLSFYIPNGIKTLEISDSTLNKLNIFQNFWHSTIKNFYFNRCNLEILENFNHFNSNVEEFDFSNNKIFKIVKNFFFKFNNLRKVILKNNLLKNISILGFNSNFLRLIDLSSSDLNNLNEIYFEKDKTSPEFELNLRDNRLYKIPLITGNLKHIHLFYLGSQNSMKILSSTGNFTVFDKNMIIELMIVHCDSFVPNEISQIFRCFISSNIWKIINVELECSCDKRDGYLINTRKYPPNYEDCKMFQKNKTRIKETTSTTTITTSIKTSNQFLFKTTDSQITEAKSIEVTEGYLDNFTTDKFQYFWNKSEIKSNLSSQMKEYSKIE
ncbi:unnamed protein product, partial [Brachionus calyciflorus]